MSIFSQHTTETNIPTLEGYQMENSHYDIFMESLEDDLSVIEAMHSFDMANIEQDKLLQEGSISDDEYTSVLTESAKDVIGKIKEGISKFFHAVMNWFKGIIDRVRAMSMDGETFVKKFGEKVRKASLSEPLKVKAYKYNTQNLFDTQRLSYFKGSERDKISEKIMAAANGSADELSKINTQLKDRLEFSTDKFIELTVGEGSDALKKFFYGSEEKEEIQIKDVMPYFNNLKDSKSFANDISKAKDVTKKEFENVIKALDNVGKQLNNSDAEDIKANVGDRTALINKSISMFKAKKNAEIRIINTWAVALNSYIKFSKAICLAAIRKG